MGMISDRFGRKTSMMIALLLHIAACIGTAFATSFLVFTSLRFFVGVSNMGIFLSAYVLGLELVGDRVRTLCGSLFMMFWCFGLFIETGVAYGLRTWWHLQLAMASPTVLFLSYIWLVEESPRWMLNKNKLTEVNDLLQKLAKINGRPTPPSVYGLEKPKGENPLRMFTNRVTLVRTLIIFLNWMVVTLVYYGLSLNVGNIGTNIYLSFFMSAMAELLGYLLSSLLLDRVGRKTMYCGSMIFSGLACLATMFPVIYDAQYKKVIILVLSNVGKMGASSAYAIIYLFSAELFPTVARNSLLGISCTIGHLGGVISPYISQLTVIVGGKLGVALPLVVMGGPGLGASLLALLLPETLHRKLPETVEDAINFGKKAYSKNITNFEHENQAFDDPLNE
ncbi:organic cation transporter protein-like [Pomacea canaliculata]|uniref:organic cation transporter protein-like n=1 Tax=Pomacea canaliculata TaxID=400727 RepID=UPI000D7359A1|nr:organic cation transporter protein-like [Pomacea canaliculata]